MSNKMEVMEPKIILEPPLHTYYSPKLNIKIQNKDFLFELFTLNHVKPSIQKQYKFKPYDPSHDKLYRISNFIHLTLGKWTKDEDEILKKAVKTHGRQWTLISESYFPTRTSTSCIKRYLILENKK